MVVPTELTVSDSMEACMHSFTLQILDIVLEPEFKSHEPSHVSFAYGKVTP